MHSRGGGRTFGLQSFPNVRVTKMVGRSIVRADTSACETVGQWAPLCAILLTAYWSYSGRRGQARIN